ncbi:MAG: DNA repair protein RadC [Lachnospira sp.]|nr:DNA repair protein RadC [Lachnospira sp.]
MKSKNSCIHGSEGAALRPYEKCLEFGAESLSDSELLAVIIRTGVSGMNSIQLAERIFSMGHTRKGLIGLSGITIPELLKIRGVGKVKAVQIKCICELSKRIAKQSAGERMDFTRPDAVAAYYMQDLRLLDKEHMVLAMLDSKCRLIADTVLSVGTVNASLVTPREVFIEALRCNAVSVILLHNHPSGDSTPSRNDILVTRRIAEAGEMLGIKVIDHIIIGDNMYTSLKEKEYM